MLKAKFEKYLGKHISIRLFDGNVYTGYLYKIGNKLKKFKKVLDVLRII